MFSKNSITNWFKSIFTPTKPQSILDEIPGVSDEKDIDIPISEDIKDKVQEKIKQVIKDVLETIPPKVVLKTARLISGEQIIGKFLCKDDGNPIIYKHPSDESKLFVRIVSPTTIRVMWVPTRPGEIQSISSFEEWMSNSMEDVFPLSVDNILCISNADENITVNYDIFTVKTRLYKRYPTIAKNLFEYAYFDVPENYDVEMDEIEDGWNESDGMGIH